MLKNLQKTLKFVINFFLKKLNLRIQRNDSVFYFNLSKLKDCFNNTTYFNGDLSEERLIAFFSKNYKESQSQLMQDIFVDYMLNKNNGFFCEVGACDGVVHSNTFWLEKKRNWKGILCEPSELWHYQLKKNRPDCIIEFSPVFLNNSKVHFFQKQGGRSFVNLDNTKETLGFDSKFLSSITLNNLFEKNSVKEIDYISIDTEGSEYEILMSLNFKNLRPTILTVEHNYNDLKRNQILKNLKNNNYSRIFKTISRFDDWYIDNIYLESFRHNG